MEVNDFVAISIVGVGLSLAIDWLKNKYGNSGRGLKAIVFLLAILLGGIYIWLRETPAFPTVLTVLGAASMFYAFLLKE
jgi:hypothetical protein